jgi:hypothetical protein
MIFWALRSAVSGISQSSGKKPPQEEVVKGNYVPGGIVAIIAIISVIVVLAGVASGHLINWALGGCVIGFPVLIMAGWFMSGVNDMEAGQRLLDDLPDLPRPEDEMLAMRQQASRLDYGRARTREDRELFEQASVTEPLRERKTSVTPVPVPSPRVIKTRRQIAEDHDLDQRLMRIGAILVAPCPACNAGEAEFCTFLPDVPISLLDRERSIVVHDARIGRSVKLGIAKVADVVAQFDGHVPDGVWETAL